MFKTKLHEPEEGLPASLLLIQFLWIRIVRPAICWHFVSIIHIALSLGAKVDLGFTFNAEYEASCSLENKNQGKSIIVETLVGLTDVKLRDNATYKRDVLLGVGQLKLQRYHRRSFSAMRKGDWVSSLSQIKEAEGVIIKSIKVGVWPKPAATHSSLLLAVQSEICRLAVAGNNLNCLKMISDLSLSVFIRYLAICRVSTNSGGTPGQDGVALKTEADKLSMYRKTGVVNMQNLPDMTVSQVDISKAEGKFRTLGISNILDRVLQTQLCLLLDAYWEAAYPEHMYGFRKGRNCLQAVGFLRSVIDRANKERLGILMMDMHKCFDNFEHSSILEHFIVPPYWKPFLKRWLTPIIINEKGVKLGKVDKGICQGLVIGPMICNVIIMKALYTSKFPKKIGVFETLGTTFKTKVEGKLVQRNVYRHLISYADDLVITTTNNLELDQLLVLIKERLSLFGLTVSKEKSRIITYQNSTQNKIKFDYLGFTFLYLPKSKVRKGGLLTRNDDVTARKFTKEGTHLTYPCSKGFTEIKLKIKNAIKRLKRRSVIEILNDVNAIIRGYANYFAWSSAYNRLRTLDGLIFRNMKRNLLKKFMRRGILRPRWVARNYLICKTKKVGGKKEIVSPYGLRWHPHVKLPVTQSNEKRLKKVLFLVYPTKVWKMLPITVCCLSPALRKVPYFLATNKFASLAAAIIKRRTPNASYKRTLFIKQKGLCGKCKLPLQDSDLSAIVYSDRIIDNNVGVELHHIKPIAVGAKLSPAEHRKYDKIDNLILLHTDCHSLITFK